VIGELAVNLGGIQYVLAFNPAHEHGGCKPVDLRKTAARAWSFHTPSAFDTWQEIAHGDFFLQTPDGSDGVAQHTHGVRWLTERLAAADLSWLKLEKPLPAAKPEMFRGQAGLDGELRDVEIRRLRVPPQANLVAAECP
jgi:hypothetical protein